MNKNYKFSFVILHYQTISDTIECIESIRNYVDYDNYYLVVVDNKSPNKSGLELADKYCAEKNIKVILNNNNLGFANGNNVGYKYAKYDLKSDFIAVINNDTFIKQKDFIDLIIDKYEESMFYILGPDIISTNDGRHQNPPPQTLQSKKQLKKYIILFRLLLLLNYFGLDKILENVKKKVLKKPFVAREVNPNYDFSKQYENIKLHGSALVFSPLYVKNYEGFNPNTFMYSEEAILYYIAKRDKLKTIYFPAVKIFHKEDSSTNSIFKKDLSKRRFYYRNFIKSGKVLLRMMSDKNIT